MCPLYLKLKGKAVNSISTQHRKRKIHGSQGSIHMIKGKHAYSICIVRSLQRENNYFKVKVGHPLKVKPTCHKEKKIAIFRIAFFSMTACPFLLLHQKYFLKIADGFEFYGHYLFHRLFLYPTALSEREDFFSFFFFYWKSTWAPHWVFNGIGYNRAEFVTPVSGAICPLVHFHNLLEITV